MIVEGEYDGPAFDGNTPDTDKVRYVWDGTPNASTSTAYAIPVDAVYPGFCPGAGGATVIVDDPDQTLQLVTPNQKVRSDYAVTIREVG